MPFPKAKQENWVICAALINSLTWLLPLAFPKAAVVPSAQTLKITDFGFSDFELSDLDTALCTVRMFTDLNLVQSFQMKHEVGTQRVLWKQGVCVRGLVSGLAWSKVSVWNEDEWRFMYYHQFRPRMFEGKSSTPGRTCSASPNVWSSRLQNRAGCPWPRARWQGWGGSTARGDGAGGAAAGEGEKLAAWVLLRCLGEFGFLFWKQWWVTEESWAGK